MPDFGGDRRSFLRRAFGDTVERFAKATEARVVRQRYVRPPGALPEVAFLTARNRCGACGPVQWERRVVAGMREAFRPGAVISPAG